MIQVTVLFVNENNFQISLPVHSPGYTYVWRHYCMEATDLQVVTLSDTVILCKTKSWCTNQELIY